MCCGDVCDDPDMPSVKCFTADTCADKGRHNCKQAWKCFRCPCKYMCFSLSHCDLCATQILCREKISMDHARQKVKLMQEDKCFGGEEFLGCMGLPCTLTLCALGIPCSILTLLGALGCLTASTCEGCCDEQSDPTVITVQPATNRIQPETEEYTDQPSVTTIQPFNEGYM